MFFDSWVIFDFYSRNTLILNAIMRNNYEILLPECISSGISSTKNRFNDFR